MRASCLHTLLVALLKLLTGLAIFGELAYGTEGDVA